MVFSKGQANKAKILSKIPRLFSTNKVSNYFNSFLLIHAFINSSPKQNEIKKIFLEINQPFIENAGKLMIIFAEYYDKETNFNELSREANFM